MKTKFKIGDLVKHEIIDDYGTHWRTIVGKVKEITIKENRIMYRLDTDEYMSFEECLLEPAKNKNERVDFI